MSDMYMIFSRCAKFRHLVILININHNIGYKTRSHSPVINCY